jgi:membrane-bound lytic murein transglycosylase A
MKQCTYRVVLIAAMLAAGCRTRIESRIEYDRPLPPGQLALRKLTDANDFPDFRSGWQDLDTLETAIRNSLSYLGKPSSERYFPYGQINHARAVSTLETVLELVESDVRPDEINGLIRAHFDVYESVGWDSKGTVLFTGYYTPIFDGSFERTERFRYPLYKMPDDLEKGPDGQTLGRRTAQGQLVPFPERAAIEDSGMLDGSELIWLGDPFEVYIAHVQGSAKVRLPDGEIVTVGYAASSGHDYVSVGRLLVDEGKIPEDRMSLAAMIDYFKARPREVDRYVRQNPRFVFFRIAEETPRGSLNEPVTPWRTIATDKSIFPRACLAFISTTLPRPQGAGIAKRPYAGFALDQDTGGAIRAPGRCDVYMGQGDQAGRLAGQTYQEGRLYYLFLKP